MLGENRKIAVMWWQELGGNSLLHMLKQGELTTKYFGSQRKSSSLTGREIELIYNSELKDSLIDTKYIYRPESKIEKKSITIYGAGKFNEEKLVLNKIEAAMLLVELHKFINQ